MAKLCAAGSNYGRRNAAQISAEVGMRWCNCKLARKWCRMHCLGGQLAGSAARQPAVACVRHSVTNGFYQMFSKVLACQAVTLCRTVFETCWDPVVAALSCQVPIVRLSGMQVIKHTCTCPFHSSDTWISDSRQVCQTAAHGNTSQQGKPSLIIESQILTEHLTVTLTNMTGMGQGHHATCRPQRNSPNIGP